MLWNNEIVVLLRIEINLQSNTFLMTQISAQILP